MSTIIDVTVECGTQEEIDWIGDYIRKTLPDNPVLVHDENVVVKALNPPPNEMLLAKYWAAKEMAENIINSLPFDDIKYIKFVGTGTPYNISNGLIQMLKKEWCR